MRSRWCTRLDLPVYGHGEVIISCIVHAPGTEVGRRRCVVAGQTPCGKLKTKGVNGPRKVLGAYSTSCAGEAGGISNASSVVFILPVPQRGRAQQVRWTHTGPSARPGTQQVRWFHTGPAARPGTASSVDSYRAASTMASQRTNRLTVMTAPATVSEAQVAAYTMCVCGST